MFNTPKDTTTNVISTQRSDKYKFTKVAKSLKTKDEHSFTVDLNRLNDIIKEY